jgi:UDP:flavonoid glycosyltransferase YjiC (YdhE family)
VVVTTGGRPVDTIPGPIPPNARVSSYLPFDWILKKTDVFVTNGGYGSVNQAMSFGITIVSAGLTEDKADVNARVAWSGVGIWRPISRIRGPCARRFEPCSKSRATARGPLR